MLERLVSCALRTPVPNIPVPQYPRIPKTGITQLLKPDPNHTILLELFPY
jgi:hypothetical protein